MARNISDPQLFRSARALVSQAVLQRRADSITAIIALYRSNELSPERALGFVAALSEHEALLSDLKVQINRADKDTKDFLSGERPSMTGSGR